MSRSTRTWRTLRTTGVGTDARTGRARATHLVHLEQRALLHLLERAHLARVGLAGEVDLAVAALADLGDDLELVDLELEAALAEEGALAPAVGLELLGVLGLGEPALLGVLVETGAALLAVRDVAEEVEVVVEEVWMDTAGMRNATSGGDLARGAGWGGRRGREGTDRAGRRWPSCGPRGCRGAPSPTS